MFHRAIHKHQVIVQVRIEVVGPTIVDLKRAEAFARFNSLYIPAWEPYGTFPRVNTDVMQTWRERGLQ